MLAEQNAWRMDCASVSRGNARLARKFSWDRPARYSGWREGILRYREMRSIGKSERIEQWTMNQFLSRRWALPPNLRPSEHEVAAAEHFHVHRRCGTVKGCRDRARGRRSGRGRRVKARARRLRAGSR